MTVPTPPAVSEAMREAVARWLQSWWPLSDRTALAHADDLLALGPIASEIARLTGERDELASFKTEATAVLLEWEAVSDKCTDLITRQGSEIARLTGERDAAVANAREPVGDVWDLVRHMEEQCRAFIREKDEWRTAALAAEAETARLRAALEDAADSFDNIANHADPFDDAVGTRDNRLLHDVEKMAGAAGDGARAALTSQEKTDV